MRPPFSFWSSAKKRTRRARCKRKRRFGRDSGARGPAALLYGGRREMVPCGFAGTVPTGAAGCGTGLDARISAARVRRSVGVQGRIGSAPLSARSAALRAALDSVAGVVPAVADEGSRPMRQPPRRGPRHPATGPMSATGPSQKPHQRARRPAGSAKRRRVHPRLPRAHPRRRAGGLRFRSRSASVAAFSLWTVHGPFLFSARRQRKWGVHPRWTSPLREQSPVAAGRKPNFHGRFVTSLTRSRGGHTIGPPRAAAPTGARNGFTPARRCAPADNPW